jgi:hypothetical protein
MEPLIKLQRKGAFLRLKRLGTYILSAYALAMYFILMPHRRLFHFVFLSDCYVAICGVPTPRADHAVAMARFATECLTKMNSLTKELEAKLVRLF